MHGHGQVREYLSSLEFGELSPCGLRPQMPGRLWTEEAECWVPPRPVHGVSGLSGVTTCWWRVLSVTARGLGVCAHVHRGPWLCGCAVRQCPVTGRPWPGSFCVLCGGGTSEGRLEGWPRPAPFPRAVSFTGSFTGQQDSCGRMHPRERWARVASRGFEGLSVSP